MTHAIDFNASIDQRAEVLKLMARIHSLIEFSEENPGLVDFSDAKSGDRPILTLFVGAAFSLWRAAFLTDTSRSPSEIVANARGVLL